MIKREDLELSIEVTVKEGDTSTERGKLLELLAKRVLNALQHDHIKTEVRVTGCELDLTAEERQTGRKILVECKAYRDRSIAADVLSKLIGNMVIQDFDAAWLITTARLGKDAKGVEDKQRGKGVEQSQRLRVYQPDQLIDLLVATNQVVQPEGLRLPAAFQVQRGRTLMVTDVGEFWAVAAIGPQSGIADTVLVFDAATGSPISNSALIQQLSERDSDLKDLRWASSEDELVTVGALTDASLKQELDSIAPVPIADDWLDYRPARPEDFVGRDDLLKSIVGFLDEIRTGASKTRLLALKAPSGWGKSSFLIKLRATCEQPRNRDKIFLYAVDCRTASSPRYPELALKRCLDEAVAKNFVATKSSQVRVPSAGQPFSDESVKGILAQLRDENKSIVLFFDQFEEITTKQELAELFRQMRMLCSAVESAVENIVLGFSWKTDGSIPTDHPAYHVWHSFADRRKEFELPPFSNKDISQLLGRLAKELAQPIDPGVRRLLTEHCQGYPWLLKKLCVHVFRVLQTQPARQRELLDRALDVDSLFEKDLADLDASQIACLEKIAKESPADHFRVVEQFGDAIVDALIQRRLVIRNSGKLILYWDIFRDFVITKQVPPIPTRYLPVSSPARTRTVMESISGTVSAPVLAKTLSINLGTLDNVARDLVMMGVCAYDRRNEKIRLIHSSERKTLAAAFRFLASHAHLRKLVDTYGKGFRAVPRSTIESCLSENFDPDDYAPNTVRQLIVRFIAWLHAFGIVSIDADGAVTHVSDQPPPQSFAHLNVEKRIRGGGKLFVGEAPPARVLEVLNELRAGVFKLKTSDRNALYVLTTLGVINSSSDPRLTEKPPLAAIELWLAAKVLQQSTVKVARALIRDNKSAGVLEIGDAIAAANSRSLSDASKRRYGSGVLVWINWIYNLISRDMSPGNLPTET